MILLLVMRLTMRNNWREVFLFFGSVVWRGDLGRKMYICTYVYGSSGVCSNSISCGDVFQNRPR
jgi:hypothetical protein